jgi:hypothetical protein
VPNGPQRASVIMKVIVSLRTNLYYTTLSLKKHIFLFQNTVDKLVQRANASILIGTSSWKEQFVEAITVSAGKL